MNIENGFNSNSECTEDHLEKFGQIIEDMLKKFIFERNIFNKIKEAVLKRRLQTAVIIFSNNLYDKKKMNFVKILKLEEDILNACEYKNSSLCDLSEENIEKIQQSNNTNVQRWIKEYSDLVFSCIQ